MLSRFHCGNLVLLMKEPIPKDLADAFENSVLEFLASDYSALVEPIVEFRGRKEPLTAICFMTAQFDDPLPERVAAKLYHVYPEHNAPFKAGLGAKPSYARAALCLRIAINHRKSQPAGVL